MSLAELRTHGVLDAKDATLPGSEERPELTNVFVHEPSTWLVTVPIEGKFAVGDKDVRTPVTRFRFDQIRAETRSGVFLQKARGEDVTRACGEEVLVRAAPRHLQTSIAVRGK